MEDARTRKLKFAALAACAAALVAGALALSGAVLASNGATVEPRQQENVEERSPTAAVELDWAVRLNPDNVAGWGYLDGLSAGSRELFLVTAGNKLAKGETAAATMKATITSRPVDVGSGISQFTFRADASGLHYRADVYAEKVDISLLDEDVAGVNDNTPAAGSRMATEARESNEGDRFQDDTTGNVLITRPAELEELIPPRAAMSLESSLTAWLSSQGISIDASQSGLQPSTVAKNGSVTAFSVLCFEKDLTRLLVDVEYDEAANAFAFKAA